MEQRQPTEHDVAGTDAHQRLEVGADVAAQVGVGQLGALRRPGGAGGVEDDRRVVPGADDRPALVRLGAGQGLLELARGHHDDVGAGGLGGLGRLLGEHGEHHRDLHPGVVPGVGDLAGLEQRVHRDDDGAEPQDRVVGDREVRHVGHDQRDAVAGRHPAVGQQRGAACGRGVERGVGEDVSPCLMAGSDGSEEARSDSQQAMLAFMRSTVVAYATFRTRFGTREKGRD